jgi:hypothetical protein
VSGCATNFFSQSPPRNEVQCNAIAEFGHQYFKHYGKQFGGKAIATAKLKLFNQPNFVSRLDISKDLVNPVVQQRQFELSLNDDKLIPVDKRFRNYVALFIPASMASKYLGQTEVKFSGEAIPHSAFLLIPRESFYKGVCRSDIKPILIGSVSSDKNHSLPQLMIGKHDIQQLATALFLDPKSNFEDELKKHYNQNKFVNTEVWPGWMEVRLSPRHSGWLRHIWNKLTKSKLGRVGRVVDTSKYSTTISAPPLKEMFNEQDRIKDGWASVIGDLNRNFSKINKYLATMNQMISDGNIDGKRFAELANKAAYILDAQTKKIQSYRVNIPNDLFVTETGSNYLTSLLNKKLDSIENQYVSVVGRYTEILSNTERGPIDSDKILNRPPLVVGETTVRPVKIDKTVSLGKSNQGTIAIKSVAFLEKVKSADAFKVRIIALADMSESMVARRKMAVDKLKRKVSGNASITRGPVFENEEIDNKGLAFSQKINFDYKYTISFNIPIPYFCGNWYNFWKVCTKSNHISQTNQGTIYGDLIMKLVPVIIPSSMEIKEPYSCGSFLNPKFCFRKIKVTNKEPYNDTYISYGYNLCSEATCPAHSDEMFSKKSTPDLFFLMGIKRNDIFSEKKASFVDGVGGHKYLLLTAETKGQTLGTARLIINTIGG